MKSTQLRDMSDDELRGEVRSLQQALFNLRMQHATGQLEKPSRLGQARKDLARALTVLRERSLAAEVAQAAQENE
jgi:large subunit ribosomal protein L29